MNQLVLAWESFLKSLLGFLPNLFEALILIVIGYIITKLVPRPVAAMLSRTRIDAVAVKYIQRVIKISLWVLIIVMALDKLGVPVTSLLTLLAAVGAAVALAIKENLANLASGIVLLFAKPFKAGDYIEIGNYSGTIREIELMHTYMDTVGNMRVAVPNGKMMTDAIINYSAHETRRHDLTYSISYSNNIAKAKEILLNLVQNHPHVLQDPIPPKVVVKEYADSSINLTIQLWCNNEDFWDVKFDLNEKVKQVFDENEIEIPFNQLDVHVHNISTEN